MDETLVVPLVANPGGHANAALESGHKKALPRATKPLSVLRSAADMSATKMPKWAACRNFSANAIGGIAARLRGAEGVAPTVYTACCHPKINSRVSVVEFVVCGERGQQRGPIMADSMSCHVTCCPQRKPGTARVPRPCAENDCLRHSFRCMCGVVAAVATAVVSVQPAMQCVLKKRPGQQSC